MAGSVISNVDLEARVWASHPLRVIRAIANNALLAMSADFNALYAQPGQ